MLMALGGSCRPAVAPKLMNVLSIATSWSMCEVRDARALARHHASR
jgi:hypothetical protein